MRKPVSVALLSTLILAFSVGYALTHRTLATEPYNVMSSMDINGMHADQVGLIDELWDAF
ncbi:MAG: hypothetical protein K2Y29_05015 [Beijerinckiaceae bacterium]|nr:hypothetical protein [Beijerinckiaceae bacterium]